MFRSYAMIVCPIVVKSVIHSHCYFNFHAVLLKNKKLKHNLDDLMI